MRVTRLLPPSMAATGRNSEAVRSCPSQRLLSARIAARSCFSPGTWPVKGIAAPAASGHVDGTETQDRPGIDRIDDPQRDAGHGTFHHSASDRRRGGIRIRDQDFAGLTCLSRFLEPLFKGDVVKGSRALALEGVQDTH